MKITSKLMLNVLALFALLASSSAFALQPTGTSGLTGTWYSVNPNTTSIVKVVISTHSNGTLHINTYGACTPTLCNHGNIHATKYSRSVGSNYTTGLTAIYYQGYKTVRVDGYRDYSATNGTFLRLNTFNKYSAGDTRKDYYESGLFRK